MNNNKINNKIIINWVLKNYKYVLFLFLYLSLGILLIFIKSPMGELDEPTHYSRVLEIVNGDIKTSLNGDMSKVGGYISESQNMFCDVQYETYRDLESKSIFHGTHPDWVSDYSYLQYSSDKVFRSSTASVPYMPFSYFPYILCSKLIQPFHLAPATEYLFIKLFAFFFYAIILFYILRRSAFFKNILLIFMLLPPILISITSVTADAFFNVVFISFFVFLFNIYDSFKNNRSVSSKDLIMFGVIIFSFGISKIPSFVFLLLLIVFYIPLFYYKKYNKLRIIVAVSASLSCLTIFAWILYVRNVNTGAFFNRNVDTFLQLRFICDNVLYFLRCFIDSVLSFNFIDIYIGSNYIVPSYCPIVLCLIFFTSLLLLCYKFSTQKNKLRSNTFIKNNLIFVMLVAFLIIIYIALVFLILYLQYTEIGFNVIVGVQPRYFLCCWFLLFCTIRYFSYSMSLNQKSLSVPFLKMSKKDIILNVACLLPLAYMLFDVARSLHYG